MDKKKVVILGTLLKPALERIQSLCDVKQWDKKEVVPQEVLVDWLGDAEGLIVANHIRVDAALLQLAPKLKVAAQPTVGYDNIDIEACTQAGIPFGNTPGVLVDATADLAFSLLLCSARRVHEGWDFVRAGDWGVGQQLRFGTDIAGKTLGIIGMGQIGAAVAKRAKAFGMNTLYYNRNRRQDDEAIGADYASFAEIVRQSDFIIVLTPLSKETRGLIGREQFKQMKSTACFINVARGPVVDTDALVEALKTGQIAYAALDVTDPEPLPKDHPLVLLPNVLITPHIGSATTETRVAMAQLTVDNVLAGLMGKPLPACVNANALAAR